MNKNVVISIDCGGTNLRVAAVDQDLNILAVRRVPTIHDNPERLYEAMKELMYQVAKEANVDIISIGVSICGTVVHNKVGKCGNLGIERGFDFAELFHRDFPNALLRIANDANCSAFVEAEYGANRGYADSCFITISSGIGLGLVHNHEMVDLPLEAGRVMINFKDKYYEAEYLLSGNGIVHLCKMHNITINHAGEFFDGVRKGEAKFVPVYNQWLSMLGIWLGNVHLMFDCQSYALSGGVMKSQDVFLEDLEKVANASIASWNFNPIVLKNAKFEQDVGIAAAASIAIHELGRNKGLI